MQQAGFEPEDYAHEVVDVLPENWRAVRLFSDICTQWRMGMAGPIGLDYLVLFRKLDRMNLDPDEYEELEQDIREMEFATLSMKPTD